jgi:hypothetical protein
MRLLQLSRKEHTQLRVLDPLPCDTFTCTEAGAVRPDGVGTRFRTCSGMSRALARLKFPLCRPQSSLIPPSRTSSIAAWGTFKPVRDTEMGHRSQSVSMSLRTGRHFFLTRELNVSIGR